MVTERFESNVSRDVSIEVAQQSDSVHQIRYIIKAYFDNLKSQNRTAKLCWQYVDMAYAFVSLIDDVGLLCCI